MAITFYSKSPEYAWLSNFSEHGFELDGIRWPTVEHYYQAQKYPGTEVTQRIRRAESALKARKIGQDRSLSVRSDWKAVKEDVMLRAVQEKFRQNRKIREKLLATGHEELLHQSSSDDYWGCGADGKGANRLGIILMEVRERLRSSSG